MIELWDNESRVARWWNTRRPLTRSLDQPEEGLAMQATRKCTVAECDRPHWAHDLCRSHGARLKAHGDPLGGRRAPGASVGCSVEGCPRPHRGRGLCSLHFQRKQRTGSTEAKRGEPRTCSVEGCDRPNLARTWCSLHYGRWERNGDPLTVRPNPAMLPGAANCKWQGESIGYTAAHDRVRAARGSAADMTCVDCGTRAEGWSYDHQDPAERIEPDDPKRKPYSVKPEHYQPRCNACHWRIDHPTGKPTRV